MPDFCNVATTVQLLSNNLWNIVRLFKNLVIVVASTITSQNDKNNIFGRRVPNLTATNNEIQISCELFMLLAYHDFCNNIG
jgi:hypothetical protein